MRDSPDVTLGAGVLSSVLTVPAILLRAAAFELVDNNWLINQPHAG